MENAMQKMTEADIDTCESILDYLQNHGMNHWASALTQLIASAKIDSADTPPSAPDAFLVTCSATFQDKVHLRRESALESLRTRADGSAIVELFRPTSHAIPALAVFVAARGDLARTPAPTAEQALDQVTRALAALDGLQKAFPTDGDLDGLQKAFPTDGDLDSAGWSKDDIEAACNAYDAARAIIAPECPAHG